MCRWKLLGIWECFCRLMFTPNITNHKKRFNLTDGCFYVLNYDVITVLVQMSDMIPTNYNAFSETITTLTSSQIPPTLQNFFLLFLFFLTLTCLAVNTSEMIPFVTSSASCRRGSQSALRPIPIHTETLQ